jgi:hypothetical protein
MRWFLRTVEASLGVAVLTMGSPRLALAEETKSALEAATILQNRCLSCHNAQTKAGGIDLSQRSSALAAGVLGDGDLRKSRLAHVVTEGRMPPTGKLPDTEIAALRNWIAQGAAYPQNAPLQSPKSKPQNAQAKPLWSLLPVRRSRIPRTPYDALAKSPVDHFVFARLAQKGLKPSPPAGKRELLRRVTIDLTGLPPTPEELDAFLADSSPNAYEKVVDRLLASPAYGERWARHWLDVVRYGESHGYEQNHLRPNAWPYRDYVIRALNEDRPYDRFIAEQLAGDVLGKGDPHIEAATGFLVAGIHDTVGIQTEEGTRQQRANDLDDIVSTTGAAFLGLTLNCARCHDHKFDPISQKDYYRMTAVFAGVRHGERPLTLRKLTEAEQQQLREAERRLLEIANRINALETQARQAVLRDRGQQPATRPAVNARQNTDEFAPVLARFVRFTILATRDKTEPCLDELQVYGSESDRNLALASGGAKATASGLLPGFPIHQIAHLNDGKLGNDHSWISSAPGTGWAQIELPEPQTIRRVVWSRDGAEIPRFDDRLPSAYRIEVSLDGQQWQTVATEAGREGSSDYIHPDDLLKALTPAQREERESLIQERDQRRRRAEALNAVNKAYIGQFTAPDPIHLLHRGDVMQRGEAVTPGALSAIRTLPAELLTDPNAPEPERRLALARWIGSPKNPLTARVMVNRVWQYHFGQGLVATASDFGHNGAKPTHPELLDWLAIRFAEGARNQGTGSRKKNQTDARYRIPDTAWSLKALHRLLVTSYTYRQSSAATAQGIARDAGNQLLWRMPLRRMEAEAIRDAILQTSGKLKRQMGGPGYRLFQYNVVNVALYAPLEEYGPETWRRGIYQQAARAIHDPLLGAFDCPETSQRAAKRESTTTALQALALLNGPFMTQQAGFFAARVQAETGRDPATQVDTAFRLAFGRKPMGAERQAALRLVKAQGLAALCRALLNANEFLYY